MNKNAYIMDLEKIHTYQEEKEVSVETSRKILKVFGIIAIVIGAIGLLLAILAIVGGGLLGAGLGGEVDAGLGGVAGGIVIISGIILLISGAVSLLQGIFSVRAANDTSKIMPAFVFSIIGLVSGCISLIQAIVNKGNFISALISLAISGLVFYAANTIRKDA